MRASDAMSATVPVKRARFAFTMTPLRESVLSAPVIGGRAVFEKIPGFASPPHDGFALDD